MSSTSRPADRVFFTEVGPRDGLQNLSQELATEAKLELIEGLLDSRVDQVEATSFVAPGWVPQLADAEAVMAGLVARRGDRGLERVRVLVPNRRGLERALRASARRVLANLGATDGFNRRNLNRSRAETLAEVGLLTREASSAGVPVDASISVAFGCPFEGEVDPAQVAELAERLLEAGVAEVGIADTIGVADPAQVEGMVGLLSERVPPERLSLHLHDTRGMALANALAAYRAGVRRFEGSVGGIGGCPFAPRSTGNVCSEDLIQLLGRLGAGLAADLGALCAVAARLEQLLGHPLPGRLYRAGVWEPGQAGQRAPA